MFNRFFLLILTILTVLSLGTQVQGLAASANFKSQSYSSYGYWSTDNYGKTVDQVSTASMSNNLYIAVRGSDNKIYTRCFCDIQGTGYLTTTDWYSDAAGRTYNAVAMTSFNNTLYQAVRGTDNKIYTRSSTDGQSWSGWQQDPISFTPDAVTLTTFNGKMYQVARGTGDKIYTRSTSNGTNWSNWSENGGSSPSPIAMSSLGNTLYQSVRGSSDNKIYTRTSTDGTNWSAWDRDDASFTPDAVSLTNPSFTSSEGRTELLYQAARGTGNKIYLRYMSDFYQHWSAWELYDSPSNPTMVTPNAPTLGTYTPQGSTDRISIMFVRGPGDYIYWF